jgi:hypothetical protein
MAPSYRRRKPPAERHRPLILFARFQGVGAVFIGAPEDLLIKNSCVALPIAV